MGIQDRIESARLLIEHKRFEDAMILLLIAIAASARKQHPRAAGLNDGEAFKRFFTRRLNELLTDGDNSSEILVENIEFTSTKLSGKISSVNSIGTIVYEQYRNNFIHEAGLPRGIQFMSVSPETYKEHTSFYFSGNPNSTLKVTVLQDNTLILNFPWLDFLISAIEKADINADIYGPRPLKVDDGEPRLSIISVKWS